MVSAITAAGVPIFFVYCAGTLDLPLRDVAIAGMSVPDSAFVGETVTARVRVAATEMAGSVAPVPFRPTAGRQPRARLHSRMIRSPSSSPLNSTIPACTACSPLFPARPMRPRTRTNPCSAG